MKFAIVLVAVMLVASVCSYPEKKNDSVKKGVNNFQKSCVKECKLDYKPICAGENKEKPKSFGSDCVLENYNCEHGTNLKKVSDGECPGGGGVRLS